MNDSLLHLSTEVGDQAEASSSVSAWVNTSCKNFSSTEVAEKEKAFEEVSFWLNGISQIAISVVGILGNSLSIPVLCSKQMNSVFNKLLVFLAVFDNIHLLFTIMDSCRDQLGLMQGSSWIWYYIWVQWPIQNANLGCSVFMTLVLSIERWLAVSRPVQYHNTVRSSTGIKGRVLRYVVPVIVFSYTFHIPKFFEFEMKEDTENEFEFEPTALRLDAYYVRYYNCYARILGTVVIPFVALAIINVAIWRAVKRRRKDIGLGPQMFERATAKIKAAAAEENRQALMLFTVVASFLICNACRVAFKLNEVLNYDKLIEEHQSACGQPGSLAILVTGAVSHFLLAVNSSLNFFLYCLMSSSFRGQLCKLIADNKRCLVKMAENLKASVCWVSLASIHAKPDKQKGQTPGDDANSLIGTPVTMENHRHCPVGVEERKSQEEVPLESLVNTDTNKSTDEMEGCVTKMKPVFV